MARFLISRNTIVHYYLDLLCASNNSALTDVMGRNTVVNFSTAISEYIRLHDLILYRVSSVTSELQILRSYNHTANNQWWWKIHTYSYDVRRTSLPLFTSASQKETSRYEILDTNLRKIWLKKIIRRCHNATKPIQNISTQEWRTLQASLTPQSSHFLRTMLFCVITQSVVVIF